MPKRVPLPEQSCETTPPSSSLVMPIETPMSNINFGNSNVELIDDALCPPWLCNHEHTQPYSLVNPPVCDACGPWADLYKNQPFPNGYIRENTGMAAELGVYGRDSFTTLCGLWTTPDFFAECCDYFDREGNQLPRKAIEYGIAYASEILFHMSGRQYTGLCERVVYPGCDGRQKLSPAYRDTSYQRDTDYNHYGADFWAATGGQGLSAAASQFLYSAGIGDCTGSSCGCGGCQHAMCNPAIIRLPGPVNQIIEIVIDGERLSPDAYRISGDRDLIRVDGGCWPQVNDLSRSPFVVEDESGESGESGESESGGLSAFWGSPIFIEGRSQLVTDISETYGSCPAWAIRYYQGRCAPLTGQLAASALARKVAEWICLDDCLPDNTARIVANGIDVRLNSRFQSIYPHFPFGIAEVDMFLGAVNPSGLRRRGYAYRSGAGQTNRRIRSLR